MSDYPLLMAAFDQLELPHETRALITTKYGEAQRFYHSLRHIDLMLRQIPAIHAFTHEMIAATLFHDIIYDPMRTDNEERSLAVFQSVAGRVTPDAPLEGHVVSAMILATKSHHFLNEHTAESEAINILLKADLSILWHPDAAVYAWYAAGVRKEYSFVPDDQFRKARAKILTGLCDDLLRSEQLSLAEAQNLKRNIELEYQYHTL